MASKSVRRKRFHSQEHYNMLGIKKIEFILVDFTCESVNKCLSEHYDLQSYTYATFHAHAMCKCYTQYNTLYVLLCQFSGFDIKNLSDVSHTHTHPVYLINSIYIMEYNLVVVNV